jgi:HPt (histidine-containing phosphotransfer) domain-containing protein
MASSEPVLDPDVWATLRALDDDPAFLNQLIDLFVEDALPRANRVRVLLASGDLSGAQATAHSIRGSAGNIGATEVAAIATAIEHDLEAGRRVDAVRGDQLHEAMQNVVNVLLQERTHPRD